VNREVRSFIISIISMLILFLVGILFFMITLAIIDISAWVLLGSNLDENWAVLSAAIVTLGSMLAGAIRQKTVLMTER
jgi:hypothetical protein